MRIRIEGYYNFEDNSDCCVQNDKLSILYPVPKAWAKWDDEKKRQWLHKNEDKINKHMCMSMNIFTYLPEVEDIEEYD